MTMHWFTGFFFLFQGVLDKGGKVLVHCVQVLNSTIHIQIFFDTQGYTEPNINKMQAEIIQLSYRAILYLFFVSKLYRF
jgi:hypothetical protein